MQVKFFARLSNATILATFILVASNATAKSKGGPARGEAAKPMQVAVCPRLVHGHGDSQVLIRRVDVSEHRVRELATCDYLNDGTAVVFYGDPGLGKTHLALALGRAACRAGYSVRFYTAHELVHTYLEAAEARNMLSLERALSRQRLVIVDELGYLPFDRTGAEYLFQFFSLCYSKSISVMLTTNLAFSQWPAIFADQERLTGALLDRLSHRLQVIELTGDSQRLHASERVAKSKS